MIGPTQSTVFDLRWNSGSAAPGVPQYSARGLRGTLKPIAAANGREHIAYTVNGTAVSIAAPQMRKYELEISGEDQDPPAFDGLWVGMQVLVDSHVEIGYLTAGGSAERLPVAGSERFEGAYTFYCPQFQMLVVERSIQREEWNAKYSWFLSLTEL